MGVITISGGIICDKAESVHVYIDTKAVSAPPDCGVLTARANAEVIIFGVYESAGYKFAMARYEFIEPTAWGTQVQYGFWGDPVPIVQGDLM